MRKTGERDTIRAARIQKVAETLGKTPRYIRMVLNGDRENNQVLPLMMELQEGENKLLEAVKKLIPFD